MSKRTGRGREKGWIVRSSGLAHFERLDVLKDTHSIHIAPFTFKGAQAPERHNFFGLYLIAQGKGKVRVDYAEHEFASPALLSFNPFQRVVFNTIGSVSGIALHFHANFFCIETHHHAVGCNGVLFNDVYGWPMVQLNEGQLRDLTQLITTMQKEEVRRDLAHNEVIVSCLKLLLIRATRLKLAQQGAQGDLQERRPEILQHLQELLEMNYQRSHRPAEYARLLHISSKRLGQLVKTHLHKTLTELIRERVLKHAKWQLLHTRRPVKEIAYEVGFEDELYFSRLFKRAAGLSPVQFRVTETELRGGKNLSM